MNRYFLSKTGWEFLDVSKAYGLGIIIHTLSGEAIVSDMGGFYSISTSKEIDYNKIDQISRFWGNHKALNWTLLTIGAKQREKKKIDALKFLTDVKNIQKMIQGMEELSPPIILGSGKETLYQPMELGATKGVRDQILLKKQYSDGSSIKIPMDTFSTLLTGHMNATIRKFSKMGMIFVIPTPRETKILHIVDEIKKRIDDSVRGLHRAGWLPTVAQIAVNLVLEEIRTENSNKFSPKFDSLIYGVMIKTGMQWKPLTGGIFPFDLLHKIAKSDNALNILNKWKDVFDKTAFRKGNEDLPSSLAEFIANPDLHNYERYVHLHLRNEIDKDKLKFGTYNLDNLEEVIEHVRI